MQPSALSITEDVWLAGVLNRPSFQVRLSPPVTESDRRRVQDHVATQPMGAFYFAKVDVRETAVVKALSALNFVVIDTNVTLQFDRDAMVKPNAALDCEVVEWSATADAHPLFEVANSFIYSRFHLDPAFSKAEANAVKSSWLQSYISGARGELLLVARCRGQIAGFLAVLGSTTNTESLKVIDLIAVHPDFRRRGVGQALMKEFVTRFASPDYTLRVGTQVSNVPSMRMYESLGWRLFSASYVMHLHAANR